MNRKVKTSLVGLGLLALISALAFAGEFKGHPNLKKAHNKVENAVKDLQAAKNGHTGDPFGGHRDKAEELLGQALGEIDQAAQFADSHPGGGH